MGDDTTNKLGPQVITPGGAEEAMSVQPDEVLFSKGAQGRYRRILELQKVAIHVIDAQYRVIYYNAFARDWAGQMGFTLDDSVLGKNLFDIFPFLGKTIRKEYELAIDRGGDLVTEESLKLAGRDIFVQIQKIPVVHDIGVVEVITIIRDITDIRETAAQLKNTEERLRTLFEYAPVAYYLSDRKGTFLDGNLAAEALIGYKRAEFIGKNYLSTDLLPKDQLPAATKILAQTILGKISGPYEIVLKHKDGSRIQVEISNIPIKIEGKTRVLGVAVDLTQRNKAQEKEKEMIHSLRQHADVGMKLGEVSKDDNIFQIIGELLHQLIGDSYIGVSDYDDQEGVIEVKTVVGHTELFQDILKIMGRDPVGMRITPDPAAVRERLQTQQLRKIPGGLYEVIFKKLPKTVCAALERLGHIQAVYSVGFIREGTIYGTAVIMLRNRDTFEHPELVESFINQVSVTLQRWKADNRIAASLKEKEVLLREIHHRVKNNMQIISSLLRLQASNLSDPDALESLQISQDRIRSMALVHEGLYRSSDLSQIDFAEYVKKLTGHLYSINADSRSQISLHVEIEDISLDINRAIPCGLIINELVTNALKHAFPGGRKGEIFIRMARFKQGGLSLTVADNGMGFPAEVDIRNTDSLGMQIVGDLVQQLNGILRVNTKDGTQFTIRF
ncbi:MAG: PAS domain S-box protein [Candidatus Aminicenantaceae bacterium]